MPSGNHWYQQMRGMLSVVVDAVCHGLASADVIGDVFDIRHGTGPRGNVHGADFETEPVARLELIGGRQDLDLIFDDLTGLDRLYGTARQLMERRAGLGAGRVKLPVGSLQPSAG